MQSRRASVTGMDLSDKDTFKRPNYYWPDAGLVDVYIVA